MRIGSAMLPGRRMTRLRAGPYSAFLQENLWEACIRQLILGVRRAWPLFAVSAFFVARARAAELPGMAEVRNGVGVPGTPQL